MSIKKILPALLVLLLLGAQLPLYAQEGEKLSDIDYNLGLILKHRENTTKLAEESAKSGRSQHKHYFIVDTISLPFVDDFSVDRFTYYHPPLFSPSAIRDSVAVNFKVNGQVLEFFSYTLEPGYTYEYNSGANRIDSFPITQSFFLEIFEEGPYPNNPYVPVETLTVYPSYTRLFFTPEPENRLDSVFVSDDFLELDTIAHKAVFIAEKSTLWLDEYVYINNSIPVNPPTIGAVTFDGLNEFGQAYAPGNTMAQGIADYLTSKPLRLAGQTNVFISFYYQPQGNGNAPEPRDSLVLEFYSPVDSLWRWQWSAAGRTLENFQQVILPVADPIYLRDGFQFRFKNYASLSGNLDHWNVDYVRLDSGRNINDIHTNDVAFTQPPNILLKNYRNMPWKQFVANPGKEMFDSLVVNIRNNSAANVVIDLHHTVLDQNRNNVFPVRVSSGPIAANTAETFRPRVNISGFTYPTSPGKFNKFETLAYIRPITNDPNQNNDTIRHIHRFDNYYAYDDGIPEAGYGLNRHGAKLAYRFEANTPDTLTSVLIHFTPVNNVVNLIPFRLTVWSSLTPENIIYQDAILSYPQLPQHKNGFAEYILDQPVVVSGSFYVGMVQVDKIELNVGFDRSFNTSNRIYYNLDGPWINSNFSGSLMIRPVFGPSNDPEVGIVKEEAPAKAKIKVYPNPAKTRLFIEGIDEEENPKISLYDLYGRKVASVTEYSSSAIDVSGLADGIYILIVENERTGLKHTSKVVVAR